MCLEGHEVHDLQVWYPEFRQDVHIDGGHAELVLPTLSPLLPGGGSGGAPITEHGGLKSPVLPLHIEVGVQGDGEILVRHLQYSVNTGKGGYGLPSSPWEYL